MKKDGRGGGKGRGIMEKGGRGVKVEVKCEGDESDVAFLWSRKRGRSGEEMVQRRKRKRRI